MFMQYPSCLPFGVGKRDSFMLGMSGRAEQKACGLNGKLY